MMTTALKYKKSSIDIQLQTSRVTKTLLENVDERRTLIFFGLTKEFAILAQHKDIKKEPITKLVLTRRCYGVNGLRLIAWKTIKAIISTEENLSLSVTSLLDNVQFVEGREVYSQQTNCNLPALRLSRP